MSIKIDSVFQEKWAGSLYVGLRKVRVLVFNLIFNLKDKIIFNPGKTYPDGWLFRNKR